MLKASRHSVDPEDIAIRALGFIATDPERLGRFLSLTGLGPETLRDAASQPWFLSAVLDFLGEDESALLTFAANSGLAPQSVALAREALARRQHSDH